MKFSALAVLFVVCLLAVACAQESEDDKTKEENWWSKFKQRVKTVLSKWRDDIKVLWEDVLAKADDMKGWTTDMFESFKLKFKEWLETRTEVPEDEKNEIETFISKLKLPTEAPAKEKVIDP